MNEDKYQDFSGQVTKFSHSENELPFHLVEMGLQLRYFTVVTMAVGIHKESNI